MTDRVPEWITELVNDQIVETTSRMRTALSIEDLWTIKGRITALCALQDEFEIKMAEIAHAEKVAVEGWTTPNA